MIIMRVYGGVPGSEKKLSKEEEGSSTLVVREQRRDEIGIPFIGQRKTDPDYKPIRT